MKKLCLFLAVTIAATCAALDFYKEPKRKLLQFGWDTPTPPYIIKNIKIMEENTPYDGIEVRFDRIVKINGKDYPVSSYSAANPHLRLQYDWFKEDVEILRQVPFRQFTDNFLGTCLTSSVDWFDDQKWGVIAHNFGVLAKCAKEAGLKGLRIDSESYNKNAPMFKYNPASGRSFEDTFNMARKRGAQIMKAIAQEYPECVIFSFIWFSGVNALTAHEALESDWYGLKIPFINGFYDEVTPYTVIHEGCEDKGYAARNRDDYMGLYLLTKRSFDRFALRETRNKIAAHTRIAPAFYLDAYLTHKPESSYYIGEKNVDPVVLLERNLGAALEFSDEYVWTWCERGKWWPIRYAIAQFEGRQVARGDGLWYKAFPGLLDAMRRAKDPFGFYAKMVDAGELQNMLSNKDFKVDADKDMAKLNNWSIPKWNCWHDTLLSKNGKYQVAEGKAFGAEQIPYGIVATNVGNGCLIQHVPVKPGEKFFVDAVIKSNGGSTCKIMVYWSNAKKQWIHRESNASFEPPATGDGRFHRVGGVVQAPNGVDNIAILLCAGGQKGDADSSAYHSVGIYKVK